ncbi:hypothetical protein AB0L06_34720 [Spirillospora sp. NPDC052269]
MAEHDPDEPSWVAHWDEEFQKLPEFRLKDYLRVFEAVHHHYEGHRIDTFELKRCFFGIDDTGRLQLEPPDWARIGDVGWDDLGDANWRAVHAWKSLNRQYRCVGMASGNVQNLSLLHWPRLPRPGRPIRTTAIHVRVTHRHGAPETMFAFPITPEGRYRRRIHFEPERVAYVRRWADSLP